MVQFQGEMGQDPATAKSKFVAPVGVVKLTAPTTANQSVIMDV